MPGSGRHGVLAVVWRHGRVLLVRRARRPQAGLWGFPGGHRLPGEADRVAALRELAEETGLAAAVLPGRPPAAVRFRDQTTGRHYILRPVCLVAAAAAACAASDAVAIGWFRPDALPRRLCPDVQRLVRRTAPDRPAPIRPAPIRPAPVRQVSG